LSELTIAGLLGHTSRGVTQRYVHLDAALAVAADQVSAEIARLLDGEIKGDPKAAALRRKGRRPDISHARRSPEGDGDLRPHMASS
jgi:hypothetical protein